MSVSPGGGLRPASRPRAARPERRLSRTSHPAHHHDAPPHPSRAAAERRSLTGIAAAGRETSSAAAPRRGNPKRRRRSDVRARRYRRAVPLGEGAIRRKEALEFRPLRGRCRSETGAPLPCALRAGCRNAVSWPSLAAKPARPFTHVTPRPPPQRSPTPTARGSGAPGSVIGRVMHLHTNRAAWVLPPAFKIRPRYEEAPNAPLPRSFSNPEDPGRTGSRPIVPDPQGVGRRADPRDRPAGSGGRGLLRRRLRRHDGGERPAAGLGPVRCRVRPGEPGGQAVPLLRLGRGGASLPGNAPPPTPTRTRRCRRPTPSPRKSPRCSSSCHASAGATERRRITAACSTATWTTTPPLEAPVSRRSSWPRTCTKTARVPKKSARRSTSTSSPTSR